MSLLSCCARSFWTFINIESQSESIRMHKLQFIKIKCTHKSPSEHIDVIFHFGLKWWKQIPMRCPREREYWIIHIIDSVMISLDYELKANNIVILHLHRHRYRRCRRRWWQVMKMNTLNALKLFQQICRIAFSKTFLLDVEAFIAG